MSQLKLQVEAQFLSAFRNDYSWGFDFTQGISIRSETLWRLLASNRVRWTSTDDGHKFGLPQPVDLEAEVNRELAGDLLTSIEIDDIGDLLLSFASGKALQVLIGSGGYESYQISVEGAGNYVAFGGGQIHAIRSP